jgi:hypothetical protein
LVVLDSMIRFVGCEDRPGGEPVFVDSICGWTSTYRMETLHLVGPLA